MYIHYTLPPVHYTVPSVHYTVPPVHYTVPPVHYTVPPVHYTIPPVHYTVPPVHYTVSSVHYTVPPVHYTVSSVHYTVPPVHYTVPTEFEPKLRSSSLTLACTEPGNLLQLYPLLRLLQEFLLQGQGQILVLLHQFLQTKYLKRYSREGVKITSFCE